MTYRLFKTPNGIKQVPVREEDEFNDFDYETQIPEEAKGVVKGKEALFVEQTRNQKRNLKESMTGQVAFQQKSLQYNNLQIVNFECTGFATGSASYINVNYNQATAVGSSLNETVMFSGISGGDNNDALYYNIVYVNVRGDFYIIGSEQLLNPSFIEFYPMQKITGGSSAGGKIPTQISNTAYDSATTITSSGAEFGVQSFGIDVFNEQTLYNQSKDLKGIRCIGLALKHVNLNFNSAITVDNFALDVEIGIDMKSGGSSY